MHAMPAEHEGLTDELIRAVELLADTLTARSVRYALVGGLAIALRGEKAAESLHVLRTEANVNH